MRLIINNDMQRELVEDEEIDFPRYTTFLINQASQTSKATRPNIVGQLSVEFPLFLQECFDNNVEPSLNGWIYYHTNKFMDALELAKERTVEMIERFRRAINEIDDELIEVWIKDLLYKKTYIGLNTEGLIRDYLRSNGLEVRKSSVQEEGRNIDLFIMGNPYQVKPETFRHTAPHTGHQDLPPVIYYRKKDNNNIEITFDDDFLIGLFQ